MALNSGIPNQEGLSTTYIYTAVAPGGTPGPASTPGSSLVVFTPGQASAPGGDRQQVAGTTETLIAAGITIPVAQTVSELHTVLNEANGSLDYDPTPYGTVSAGAPTAGQEPSPMPTLYHFNTAEPSNGQQPAVSTPFTNAGWSVKTVV